MKYGSVCSGIEAASVAWHPLGWRAAFLSEIESFPRAVLTHHYPDVPLHGDFTTIEAGQYDAIDLLVGGTPCQSFSVAGLRGGLADDRGNLALEYLRLAARLRPRWLVWENVPGVLSSNGGRDFGAILGGMVELGYGIAYRVLDAQHFGVPQRRRRVFVVGYLGDWRRAAAVLFERHSLQGHPTPRREAGEEVAGTLGGASGGASQAGGFRTTDLDNNGALIAGTVSTKWHKGSGGLAGDECQNLVTHSLRADGFDASEDGTGRGTPLVASFNWQSGGDCRGLELRDTTMALQREQTPAVAFAIQERAVSENVDNGPQGKGFQADTAFTMEARKSTSAGSVRRLTVEECEALQGFPRGYTLVTHRNKLAADGPRYKALGNSMAVPCMRWIGERIHSVELLTSLREAA